MSEKLFWIVAISAILVGILYTSFTEQREEVSISKFDSCSALIKSFKEAEKQYGDYYVARALTETGTVSTPSKATDYSETNIQVEGVDEADIVKTDGKYIYVISENNLIIAEAYPTETAQIVSKTHLEITPSEMFIDKDTLLIFGSSHSYPIREEGEKEIYPYYTSMTTAELWDVEDRSNPQKVRSVDFEGNYFTSRKIESRVYFVVNTYPHYYALEESEEIVPLYRDRVSEEVEDEEKEFTKTCLCADVGYLEPINPQSFITLVSMSMSDVEAEIEKEVIVGSGQNVYASLENIYIAEVNYRYYIRPLIGIPEPEYSETTNVHKFALEDGEISYIGKGEVPGTILNQFSMDEFDGNFRIATTKGFVSRTGGSSTNNIYVYDEDMELIGKLEDLAPGEEIYSARFMGDRGYLVTFKKIDPLFVIDLSNPENPRVLGKLKIPGYSDYLHPYDENHIIGIGKETVEAEEGDFAWYQGVKMALFDVSDVENPKELHKVVIGDRGTDSPILHDHKAFLFDRKRNLLVIPILLAEIDEDVQDLRPNTYGEYVFQGAYVYRITLDDGFELRGRITHYDDDEAFKKSGYYFYGEYSIERSLYIDDVLYTVSQKKIKLNSLEDLSEIKELVF